MQGEVGLGWSQEEKLAEEVKALQGRLGDLTHENTRISKELERVEAKYDELLSCQKEMVDRAFIQIMTEV